MSNSPKAFQGSDLERFKSLNDKRSQLKRDIFEYEKSIIKLTALLSASSNDLKNIDALMRKMIKDLNK